MKNIALLVTFIFLVSCENKNADDPIVCCVPPPVYYKLSLFVKTSDARANNLPAESIDPTDTERNTRIYFYRLNESGGIVKIRTWYDYGYSNGFSEVYSKSKNIYDPIAGKGLVTVCLHKLHGAVDTLQIDVGKDDDKALHRREGAYIMRSILINGRQPVVFEGYGGASPKYPGYGYYLPTDTTGRK